MRKGDVLRGAGPADETNTQSPRLEPGTLWKRAHTASRHALERGVLKSIPAVAETVRDGGIAFTVWRLAQPSTQLPADRAQFEKPAWSERDANPFLPYDPDMFVSELSETHICLLNKYNVLNTHLLLVTRVFEHQTDWLNVTDFEAIRLCLTEFDGLAFYNGGRIAGASQRHKHLQYVPLPLAPNDIDLPISAVIPTAEWDAGIASIDSLPFVHALARIGTRTDSDNALPLSADALLEVYRGLLSATGIHVTSTRRQSMAYNLLATREWMLIAPRQAESYEDISVNALGFAGSLLVRDHAQLDLVRSIGPLALLSHVGIPRNSDERQ